MPISKSRSESRLSQTFVSEGLTFNPDKYTNGCIKTARCGTKDTDLSIINELKDTSNNQFNTDRSHNCATYTDYSASKND